MGFRKPLDYNSINHQLYMAGVELNNGRNDGFTQFEIKKDLYKLHDLLGTILTQAPKFAGEDAWLEEQAKTKVVQVLGR